MRGEKMEDITIQAVPYKIHWINEPHFWKLDQEGGLTIRSGELNDWFVDPAGNPAKDDTPCAAFAPREINFLLSAKLHVGFASAYDAGGLLLLERNDLWGKVCFECTQQLTPTVVSVVTRGLSDDCVSTEIDSSEIYLRIAHTLKITAFHYSRDGQYWHLVRYFTLGELKDIKVGFLSQSPTGHGCEVRFSEISYSPRALTDYRSGE
jgi:regulation of enolase protein 1 (concanavalin A-like superfamily)